MEIIESTLKLGHLNGKNIEKSPIILDKLDSLNKENSKNKIYKKDYVLKSFLQNTNNIVKKPIHIQYNPNYTNFNISSQAGVSIDAKSAITTDSIPEFAYPLAQFINQIKPDYVIACDRGARIIALAIHMMYGQLYGEFPTQDHAISFRKISRRAPPDAVREMLRPYIKRMLENAENPTVLVLDDWVNTGGTKEMVQDIFAQLSNGRINLLYGVMRGEGADISGNKGSYALGDWHDKADLIGVDYSEGSLVPKKVNSFEAKDYRRRMSRSIRKFVSQLKKQTTEI